MDEEELLEQPPASRQGTVVESFAHYEGSNQRRDSMPPPPAQPQAAPRRTPTPAPPPPPPADQSSPWSLSVLLLSVPRYLWRNFWSLLVGALLLAVFAHIKLPETAAAQRDEFFRGLKIAVGIPGYDQPPGHLETLWTYVRYNSTLAEELKDLPKVQDPVLQQMLNVRFHTLLQEAQRNSTALAERQAALEQYLPPRMVVDVIDGEVTIKDDFWHALRGKLKGSSELFDAFIAANENVAAETMDKSVDKSMRTAMLEKRILSREDTLQVLEQSSKDMEKRLTAMLESGNEEIFAAARTMAAQVATEIAEKTPSDVRVQLSVLAKSNILQNTYDAISSVNYLAPNLGAVIDPHHSSPTAQKVRKVLNAGWFSSSLKRRENPPIAALMKWDEAGDCWCASESEDKGKAQLAIFTEHKIIPQRLIVEHIPARGTKSIATAPQAFEFWAEASSVFQASLFKEQIGKYFRQYDMAGCIDTDNPPPSETAVCVGVGRYDIHGDNWVQVFDMFMDLQQIHFAAGKFFYRVVSNWGAAQTCTYRIRLAGIDTEDEQ